MKGLSDIEMKVVEAVRGRAGFLLEDLRLHVGIPTGQGHVAGLDETRGRFVERCAKLGAVVEYVPGDERPGWLDARDPRGEKGAGVPPVTAVCRRLGAGAQGGGVLIAGHLDTVHDPRSATFNSLVMSADGARAVGPGVVDMKGGLVIAMSALEVLEEVVGGGGARWAFLMNSDEETGSFHSDRALRAEASSGRYVAGLALEPAMADGGLAVRRGGSGQFMIEARGKQAHVGRDFVSGRSATLALARAVVGAGEVSRPEAGVCVNVSPVWCEQPTNVVSDWAKAWGNVRVPSVEAGEEVRARLEGLNVGDRLKGDLPEVRVRVALNRPAKPRTAGTEALAELVRGAAEDLGQKLPFGETAGVCDGNNLQAAGLATLDTLGVRGGGLHTTEEWIEVASLVERCALLAVVILRVGEEGNSGWVGSWHDSRRGSMWRDVVADGQGFVE